jgi:molybdate transport system regulatory protein
MKPVCKVWLDNGGKAFGEGPLELLKGVERTASLHKASTEMGMAYSKAWRLIREMEDRLGFLLLERKTGGPSGGGSRLTPEAVDLMKRFDRFHGEVRSAVHALYRKHFVFPE